MSNSGTLLGRRAEPGLSHLSLGREMIRELESGEYRPYSRKKDPRTGRRRSLGMFKTRAEAQRHEWAIQPFKRRG